MLPSTLSSIICKGLMVVVKGLQTLYQPLTTLHFSFYKLIQSAIITLILQKPQLLVIVGVW